MFLIEGSVTPLAVNICEGGVKENIQIENGRNISAAHHGFKKRTMLTFLGCDHALTIAREIFLHSSGPDSREEKREERANSRSARVDARVKNTDWITTQDRNKGR
jgi:hypothetical protein